MEAPDLREYRLHRVADPAEIDGVPLPGLSGSFYRRAAAEGERSVGVYRRGEADILQAWGYAAEPHCRAHRVRNADGTWGPATPGCPDVRPADSGSPAAVRRADDSWLPLT